ncbi:trifunctional formate-tetrahydrofolate ligase/methenyltetrahydrofolate cyclohydrolase/methylenetetrahydrofolate dehydrogenase [Maudiozyma humilis]|uniref:Trifunctional formate-tetrahydrofolate ligase/methenyltetrahydrofolate cyclohydrolase/methylenetetrahydrofolate dehydrogenase n=1 Tax=Maudiozyma humilis TaxID=51915 RepID=A0AAV5S3I7_MAUHU|nr:trifunctional formate-tetrahydrofolate ligase/methenyltetrahydrofolate cyclohydrolase/methylenetetrahydrofolate dehydrogenase [Kazachstania humilis]
MLVTSRMQLLRYGGRTFRHVARSFTPTHTSRVAPAYHTMSGTEYSKLLRQRIKDEVRDIKQRDPRFAPRLKIIQVGARPDSSTYVRMKQRAAEACDLATDTEHLPADISQAALLHKIAAINNDPTVQSIMIQLPLPSHIDESAITEAIAPEKDVDGLTTENIGRLTQRSGKPYFLPCTPNGIIRLLKHHGVQLRGKLAVVIGRSDIVGVPVATLLRDNDATVIQCHSRTANVDKLVGMADIVVAACGVPQFVKGEWLKQDAVVVDVGINYIPDPSKKSGQRLVGDVDFESAKDKASLITPVPGGIGPMTVSLLMNNALAAAKHQREKALAPIKIEPLPLETLPVVPSDFEIAKAQTPKDIAELATELGILPAELELFGSHKAKISHSVMDRLSDRRNGKYILVAGITPTPLGEGKSTTTVGLVQALTAHLGKPSIATLRQPSMGPTFGVKGGAAGGGYSQVIPMDEFNLHLTGDIHAIGAANNLLAAAIDTRVFHETTQKNDAKFYGRLVPRNKGKRTFTPSMKRRLQRLGISKENPDDLTPDEIARFARLNINPDTISIKRVVDVNDRMLRRVTIGEAPTEKGHTRVTGFDITVASELMAILALSNSMHDMSQRIARMVVAFDHAGNPVTTDDIGCAGALTALLRDAIKPNMMQTLEGTPVLVHAGPFANISIGASSVSADLIALKLMGTNKSTGAVATKAEPGYVITEAGFDFTMGGERFFDIKCRASGLVPNAVVLVATIRALKSHGGAPNVKPGQSLPEEYLTENVKLVEDGVCNLVKQIENVRKYGVPVVVAINKFGTDTDAEIEVVRNAAKAAGALDAVVSTHFENGGKGAINLAKAVVNAADQKSEFKPLYDLTSSFEEKMTTIVQELYNGKDISISPEAQGKLEMIKAQGFGHLPICVAKTQYSLSHDATLKGVPSGFTFPIRDVRLSTGGGYIQALANEIQTIPGLSTYSGYMNVEVNDKNEIEGLF